MELLRITSAFVLCLVFYHDGIAQRTKGAHNCPAVSLPNGRTRIRGRGRMIYFRCRRGFQRIGARYAVCLKTNQWSQRIPKCVDNTCPKPHIPQDVKVKESYKGAMLKFTCELGLIRNGPEIITCDGRRWSDQPPECVDGTSMGCDFEGGGMCGWSQDTEDDFDWIWHTGQTPTTNTGPMVDHTTNTSDGHYIFMESSAPQKSGDKARLVSPTYQPKEMENMCLEFYYHMFGKEMGSLEVFVKPAHESIAMLSVAPRIFIRKGNYGNVWVRADEDIPKQSQPFQLVFQGTRETGWTSDIAVDDIRIFNCTDRPTTTTFVPQTTRTTTTTTTTPKPITRRTTTTKRTTTTATTTTTTPTTTTTTMATTTTTPTTTSTTTTTTPTTTTTTTIPTITTPTTPSTTTTATLTTPPPTPTTEPTTQSETTFKTTEDISDRSDQGALPSNKPSIPSTYMTTDTISSDEYDFKDGDDDDIDDTTDDPDYSNEDHTDSPKSTTESDFVEIDDITGLNSTFQPASNDTNTPFVDFEKDKGHAEFTTSLNEEETDGLIPNIGVGEVKGDGSETSSGTRELLPLIIGVVAAVLVVAVVISVLAWKWTKNRRQKQAKEQEDQMNIITEYVETNLSII